MRRLHFTLLGLCCVAIPFASCGTTQTPTPATQATKPATATKKKAATKAPAKPKAKVEPIKLAPPPDFDKALVPDPWDSVAEVKAACKDNLAKATGLKKKILAVKGDKTLASILVPYNEMLIALDHIIPMSELISNVHPQKKVRTAAEKCAQRAKKFESALKLDRGLYEALKGVKKEGLKPLDKRFLAHLLRDYRRAGVDRDAKTRKKLALLDAKLVKLGQTFSRNIRNDKRTVKVTEAQLAGLPKDFIAAAKKNAKGKKLTITTDYPSFYPVISYAKDESVRKAIYKAFLSRAYPKNEKILKKILAARYTYATALGYPDWAAYNAEDKMVKTKKVISDFLAKVVKLARPRMEEDLKEVLARKKKDNAKASAPGVWDRFYYINKLRAERFGVDPTEVRAYFEFGAVKKGVLATAQKMFAVTFKKVDAKVWHPSVEAYDVYDRGKRIARFYLDLYPRKGKYGHAAEFSMYTGIPGVQLPMASLVTNFPNPKTSTGPALTEHRQVVTFFHEFGHLMHQLLGGQHRWVTQSGINCEWDFVEAPSQLLEEWPWTYDILKTFAKHYKTGKVIPKALVEKMRKAEEVGKGMDVMRQMFYAYLSFNAHNGDPKKINLMKLIKKLHKEVSPYPHMKGTAVFANFGHIEGYSSMYYTYMWSKVLAKDMFTRFQKEGLLNPHVTLSYRKTILAPGGTVDAAKMVENFLGRPYAFEAYRAWLQAR